MERVILPSARSNLKAPDKFVGGLDARMALGTRLPQGELTRTQARMLTVTITGSKTVIGEFRIPGRTGSSCLLLHQCEAKAGEILTAASDPRGQCA